jgi:nucleotide-binding universal stress UspA family protein
MYQRILVPYDGSPTAERGLMEAIGLARDQNAALRIFHVVEEYVLVQSAGFDGAGLFAGDLLDALIADSKKVIARGLALARENGVQADSVSIVRFADRRSECIVEEAKKWPADLIVMGTHGRRGVSRMLMGSDAEIVLRTAPVPVLLVRIPEAQAAKKAREQAPGEAVSQA